MKKKKDYDSIVKKLKELFDAVPNEYMPDEEEVRFMKQRNKLEEQSAWSFEAYVQNYEKLKAYGLEEKLISDLEFFIRLEFELNREEFLKSEFYKKFKEHKIVSRVKRDYE